MDRKGDRKLEVDVEFVTVGVDVIFKWEIMPIPSSLTTYYARPYHPSSFTPSHPSFRASYGRSRIGFTMRNIIINCLSRSVTNRARLRILLNFANFLESCLPYSTGWPPSWSWWSTSGSLLSTSFHLFKVPVYTVLEVKKSVQFEKCTIE